MQLADTVCLGCHLYCKNCHAEFFSTVSWLNAPKVKETLYPYSKSIGNVSEITAHEVFGKPVDACRNRGVGGKYAGCPHCLKCLVKVHVLFLHQVKQPFYCHKCRMPFVHVAHCGRMTKFPQHSDTTHSKDYFLLQAGLQASAIKMGGNLAVVGRVYRHVSIKHVDIDPADCDTPDPCLNGPVIKWYLDGYWPSVVTLKLYH